ncbi:hypothetical protein QBC43DRAFT_220755 [Cladorrhinum sp. PSN259]|nr:hypothetical protein QBC43DRAFT_220755 [Cladorrhinum sp. PSN259]
MVAVAGKTALAATVAKTARAVQFGITPHEQFGSSIGVLGGKIDTNRVAYWPEGVDCNNICVRVSYQGRSVELLRIDQSGGAHDISYDAWNYLTTGFSAKDKPTTGGAVTMDVEYLPGDSCRHLLKSGGLPLSAPNSINYLASCLSQSDSWVSKNHQLFNIKDSGCHYGWDEQCTLDLAVSNQPTCPHQLGTSGPNLPDSVFNIQYGTGAVVADPSPPAC